MPQKILLGVPDLKDIKRIYHEKAVKASGGRP
jgi:hypothetical protein